MPDRLNNDVLHLRCIDNRTRPANEAGDCPNEPRLIGGILEADFLQATFKERNGVELPADIHHQIQQHKIIGIIDMKKSKKVVIASHEHCGAAATLGYDHPTVLAKQREWARWIRKTFPHIEVKVVHDRHSECGLQHEGHIPIELEEELPLQMAAQES